MKVAAMPISAIDRTSPRLQDVRIVSCRTSQLLGQVTQLLEPDKEKSATMRKGHSLGHSVTGAHSVKS